jgi:hypothetical protein
MNKTPVCGNCKHYYKNTVQCHRYPPVFVGMEPQDVSVASFAFPTLSANRFCGEFKENSEVVDDC